MQITETNADGLRREFKVVIPAQDLETRVTGKLIEIGKTLRVPGFRPGKVPMTLLRQRYGQSVMGEVIEGAVNDGSAKAIKDHNLRPALQPKVEIAKFADGQDLEIQVQVEVLPEFEPADLSSVAIEKPVVEIAETMIDEAVERVAKSRKTTAPLAEPRPAVLGDVLKIDFDGSVDGEKRPGMKGEDFELELGTKSFVDTFEEQLVGASAGEHRTVTVTFPADYHAAELAGREAVFEVDVKEVLAATVPAIDDEFAKGIGYDDLAAFRGAVRERMQSEYGNVSRLRAKRALLDRLAELHSFDVPAGMVEIEFEQIWARLQEELKRGGGDPADAGKDEEALKVEYRAIAERRVRLGLLLSEIGRRNTVTVSREELTQAVIAEARKYPGQEQQVFEYFGRTPQAVEALRAPLFEDKVVDYILGTITVTETPVSVEALLADPDEDAEAAAA